MIAKMNDPKVNYNTRKTIEVLGHDLKIGDKFMDKLFSFRIVNITYDTDWKMSIRAGCSSEVNRYIVTGEWMKIDENETPPSYCYPTNNSIIRALREDLYWTMLVDEGYDQSFSKLPAYGFSSDVGNELLYNM
jgi:hypothetical protein